MRGILLFFGLFTTLSVNAQNTGWFCDPAENNAEERWYDTEIGRQKALIIYPEKLSENSNLVVFIHGDSPFGDPVYQYNIARDISEITNAITVAILRPGYRDGCGDVSDGVRGFTMGDNYTAEVVQSLANMIEEIRKEYVPSQLVVMGHSGGAALTALLAESNTELADKSILVACPCNLGAWRRSMEVLTGNPNWSNSMGGLSPMDNVQKLTTDQKINLYVGENDVVAPPFLSEEFYGAADQSGADVKIKIVPGEDHETILKRTVLSMIFEEVGL